MEIFKKKISPEELKTKLSIYEQRLSAVRTNSSASARNQEMKQSRHSAWETTGNTG